jgi:hypothetical protein
VATAITAEERGALYEQVLSGLSGVDDLRAAFVAEEFDRAERLGIEFGDELRLMEDLGWGDAPVGKAVTLTMPREQLHRVLTRLRRDAEALRADEEREQAEAENETREHRLRATRVAQVCERVLGTVDKASPCPLDPPREPG